MGITVNFGPSGIDCGVVPPGGSIVQTTQCGTLSAPAFRLFVPSAENQPGRRRREIEP
jgi:hypothetical protein